MCQKRTFGETILAHPKSASNEQWTEHPLRDAKSCHAVCGEAAAVLFCSPRSAAGDPGDGFKYVRKTAYGSAPMRWREVL